MNRDEETLRQITREITLTRNNTEKQKLITERKKILKKLNINQ